MNYYGKGNMMSVREDVVVLDATLRDGGLVNDFYFTDDFVRDLYKTNLEAGVIWSSATGQIKSSLM